MKTLFLDESGDHNLSVIDPNYPIFVLGGVIVDNDYAEGPLTEELNRFKREMFGHDAIILHTADIVRNRNGFEALKDSRFRNRFYNGLNDLMQNLSYSIVACVIRKYEHLRRYMGAARDPYHLSLNVLVERFCLDIGNVGNGGSIVAESREPTLDRGLKLAWSELKTRGTGYIPAY